MKATNEQQTEVETLGKFIKTEFCVIAGEEVAYYENGKIIGERIMLNPSYREFVVTVELIESLSQYGKLTVSANSEQEAKAKAIELYNSGEYNDEEFNLQDGNGHYGYKVHTEFIENWEVCTKEA